PSIPADHGRLRAHHGRGDLTRRQFRRHHRYFSVHLRSPLSRMGGEDSIPTAGEYWVPNDIVPAFGSPQPEHFLSVLQRHSRRKHVSTRVQKSHHAVAARVSSALRTRCDGLLKLSPRRKTSRNRFGTAFAPGAG